MDKRKLAEVHAGIIKIFYLVSGIWIYLVGLTQAEATTRGIYFLLDIYRNYCLFLGIATILVGIGLFAKLNIARLGAIILAWWNLFTAPAFNIWWHVYSIKIKKFLINSSLEQTIIYIIALFLILSAVRIYIIYMLSARRVGALFLRHKKALQKGQIGV